MKSRIRLAWLVVGTALTITRLAAQDVTVTDPAWLDPEFPPADVLPTFKNRPKPGFPEELKKPGQIAYALIFVTLDEKGKRMSLKRVLSNPYLTEVISEAVSMDQLVYEPAKRGGASVMSSCWFAYILNPDSASLKKADGTPRLQAVSPIVVGETELPAGTKLPLVVWATLSIDEKGQLQSFVFDEPAYEVFRPQVGGSIHLWRFAAARKGGQTMAAKLKVPLILTQVYKTDMQTPKIILRVDPVEPHAMSTNSLRGKVLLDFTVDTTGAVKDPMVKQTDNPGYNEAAIEAILKWKFEPAKVGGEPVNARLTMGMVFKKGEDAHDFATVDKLSKKNQKKLPERLRYDIAPKPIGVLIPVYPYPLVSDKINGHASVVFIVDEEGRVSGTEVIEASKPEFGLAMVAVVESLSFIPAMKDGKPTRTILRMEHKFVHTGLEPTVTDEDRHLLTLEKKHPEEILSAKKLDAPLKPVSQRSPVFPTSLLGQVERGEAKIEVIIDEEGKVHLPRISAATDPAFGYAAVQAVIGWRFEPPKTGGKPAIVRVLVPFGFKHEIPGGKPAPASAIDQATLESAIPQEKEP